MASTGISAFAYPKLANSDEAYMTLVTKLLPVGMVGLMMSVLIAALVSTVSGGLNSLSTVFTLDIYCKTFRPNATPNETAWLGRVITVVGAAISVVIALAIGSVIGIHPAIPNTSPARIASRRCDWDIL
jgi:SSS family solute:Na+ symporter